MVLTTSVMLVVEPSTELFRRVKPHFGTWRKSVKKQYFDMDIVNKEFACKDQVFVLPSVYGTLDSAFKAKTARERRKEGQCRNFDDVQYLHFSSVGKPWTHGGTHNSYLYVAESEFQMARVFIKWFDVASAICPELVSKLTL